MPAEHTQHQALTSTHDDPLMTVPFSCLYMSLKYSFRHIWKYTKKVYHPSEDLCTKFTPLAESRKSEVLVMLEGITRQHKSCCYPFSPINLSFKMCFKFHIESQSNSWGLCLHCCKCLNKGGVVLVVFAHTVSCSQS